MEDVFADVDVLESLFVDYDFDSVISWKWLRRFIYSIQFRVLFFFVCAFVLFVGIFSTIQKPDSTAYFFIEAIMIPMQMIICFSLTDKHLLRLLLSSWEYSFMLFNLAIVVTCQIYLYTADTDSGVFSIDPNGQSLFINTVATLQLGIVYWVLANFDTIGVSYPLYIVCMFLAMGYMYFKVNINYCSSPFKDGYKQLVVDALGIRTVPLLNAAVLNYLMFLAKGLYFQCRKPNSTVIGKMPLYRRWLS